MTPFCTSKGTKLTFHPFIFHKKMQSSLEAAYIMLCQQTQYVSLILLIICFSVRYRYMLGFRFKEKLNGY